MKKRKDGRWVKVVTFNGKRISFYSTADTEKKAIKDIEKQLISYTEKKAKGALFKDVAIEWRSEHFPKLEYNTQKYYNTSYCDALSEFGNCSIKDIDSLDITRFLEKYNTYAKKTVKARLLTLNLIFKYAVVHSYVDKNPCTYISVDKNLAQTKRELPTAQELNVIRNSTNATFGLFAYFLLYTGLRKAEALALTWKDINFEDKIINVSKSVYWIGNSPHLKTPKTTAGTRSVILLDALSKKLISLKKSTKPKADDIIFCNDNKELMHHGNFERLWNKFRKETGLTLTAHQLRHAYATILYEAGIDVKDAQVLMGHADISTTQNIYTHISEQQRSITANKLNQFVSNL